jgi:hypothetical protein
MRRAAIRYSDRELAFLWTRRTRPRREMHAAFAAAFGRADVTAAHIKALCTRHGWTTSRAPFTADADALLCKVFADRPTAHVAALLGRPVASVIGRARKLGLRKSPDYLATPAAGRLQRGNSTGAVAWYARGAAPVNKGVKRPEGWSPGRMGQTQFQKAHAPRNWRPIGSVRVVKGYQFTKVADERLVSWTKNWRQTHVLNWEALHGAVPSEHALKSIDGDATNTAAANWQLIPRAILPRLNGGRGKRLGYDRAPDELKPILLTTARLAHAVQQRRAQGAA